MANNRHFWRKGEICRVMTLDEIKEELRVKETGLGLWTSDSKYGEFILAFMPNEYKNMGRIGEVIHAEYDYYATVEFEVAFSLRNLPSQAFLACFSFILCA